jgi:quercetin dioxygenase-like cupin family protein
MLPAMDVIRPLQQPGSRKAPAEWFTGDVWIDSISTGPHVRLLSVHFAPGARTAWHAHPFGQTIHVTEGAGLAQTQGGAVEPIRAGDTVFFEPNEVHWHGAGPSTFMTHLAMQEVADDGSDAVWGPQVTDAEYSSGA